MEFSYVSQIHVNSCYTKHEFDIPKIELTEFKHILITGKNGTGKTTILNSLGAQQNYIINNKTSIGQRINILKAIIKNNKGSLAIPEWQKELSELENLKINYLPSNSSEFSNYIFAHFRAHRKVEFNDVTTVVREEDITNVIDNKQNQNSDYSISALKQYLVNKKVYEAFDRMNEANDKISQSKKFFENLTDTLRNILEDDQITLEFVHENFEFYINLSDGRKITFNQLSEGFSAFFSIVIDLLIRVDLYRKQLNNYEIDPPGIIVIDEPETHFHLSLQYNILPLINKLFPKMQLIVATHSPAVISSLKNAIVFDLSTMEEISDWLLGSSYSELMVSHFGLENEFSPIADKIINDVRIAVKEKDKNKLEHILIENDKYLTPSLRLEIESQIIHIGL